VRKALEAMSANSAEGAAAAKEVLQEALKRYETNEA
jgi:hypothetical protein